MTRTLAIVALIAAAAAAGARQPTFESPRADLRAKFTDHGALRYLISRETLMEGPNGDLLGSTVYSEFEFSKAAEPEAASVPLRARYRAFALELRTVNGLTTFDSRDPAGTNERGKGFESAGRAIVRTVYDLDVARNGVVTDMRARNENSIIDEEPIRSLLNHEALQREFTQLFSTRCDVERPLVGHTWSTSVSWEVAMGIWMVVTHQHTLTDVEKDIAIIHVKSTAAFVPQDPTIGQLRQRIAPNEHMGGVIKWNTADGVMEEYELVLDYDMVTSRDGLAPNRQRFVQSYGAVRVR